MRVLITAAAMILSGATFEASSLSRAHAAEVYHCEALRGKSFRLNGPTDDWRDDFYGPSTVILDNSRFIIAAGSSVPDNIKDLVGSDRSIYDVNITSQDIDHVMGFVAQPGGINVFHFHRPTKSLVNVVTFINHSALPDSTSRDGYALAFVAPCQ